MKEKIIQYLEEKKECKIQTVSGVLSAGLQRCCSKVFEAGHGEPA